MTPTRAFVVAPTPVTRAGLRSMLANAEGTDVRVVGEASSPTDSSELSEADVVLLANEELLEEASFAVAEDGTQALVLISEEDNAVSRLRAMQLRGWGVVPPDAPPEELAAAVAAAGQGLIVLPKAVTERLLMNLRPPPRSSPRPSPRASGRSWISSATASPTSSSAASFTSASTPSSSTSLPSTPSSGSTTAPKQSAAAPVTD